MHVRFSSICVHQSAFLFACTTVIILIDYRLFKRKDRQLAIYFGKHMYIADFLSLGLSMGQRLWHSANARLTVQRAGSAASLCLLALPFVRRHSYTQFKNSFNSIEKWRWIFDVWQGKSASGRARGGVSKRQREIASAVTCRVSP